MIDQEKAEMKMKSEEMQEMQNTFKQSGGSCFSRLQINGNNLFFIEFRLPDFKGWVWARAHVGSAVW